MTRSYVAVAIVFSLTLFAGCGGDGAEKIYDLKGKVTAVDHDKRTITVDHEEIPGLMRAMKMTFGVDDPKLLEGLVAEDVITGKLKAAGTKYNLVEIHKVGGDPPKAVSDPAKAGTESAKAVTEAEAERQAELAKLSPEDRKAAEAQRFCPESKDLLGSMGVPVKVMVQGQAVFVCCGGCKKAVEARPYEETLKKIAELKKKE
jgi:Cu/Ag efflux protein CusF